MSFIRTFGDGELFCFSLGLGGRVSDRDDGCFFSVLEGGVEFELVVIIEVRRASDNGERLKVDDWLRLLKEFVLLMGVDYSFVDWVIFDLVVVSWFLFWIFRYDCLVFFLYVGVVDVSIKGELWFMIYEGFYILIF